MKIMKVKIYNNIHFRLGILKQQKFFQLLFSPSRLFSILLFFSFFIYNVAFSQITTTTWNFNANSTGWTGNIVRTT